MLDDEKIYPFFLSLSHLPSDMDVNCLLKKPISLADVLK
jgi:hypothetical protein